MDLISLYYQIKFELMVIFSGSSDFFPLLFQNFSLIGTDIITNFPAIEWHHLNAPKDKEGNEKLIQLGEGVFT